MSQGRRWVSGEMGACTAVMAVARRRAMALAVYDRACVLVMGRNRLEGPGRDRLAGRGCDRLADQPVQEVYLGLG